MAEVQPVTGAGSLPPPKLNPPAGEKTTESEGTTTSPTADVVAGPVKSDPLPTPETLKTIYAADVLDKDGKAIKFSTLVQETSHRRNIIVFIRHFLCGYCQEYIRALNRDLPPAKLAAMPVSTVLTIVGCGDPSLIAGYTKETQCPYEIYADPSRKLYTALNMVTKLGAPGKVPKYITIGFWNSTLAGIMQGLKTGTGALKSGKISQNGGELVWLDGECKYIHRMTDPMTHLEVHDLEKVLEDVE